MAEEMEKFKEGRLHSGSKEGPVVESRKQAIAIALSESGQSREDKKKSSRKGGRSKSKRKASRKSGRR